MVLIWLQIFIRKNEKLLSNRFFPILTMTPELDPQPYFEQGFSKLLKEDFYQSLDCYLKGLRISKDKWSVLTLTKTLNTCHQANKTNTNLDLMISTCLLYLATIYSDKWASTQLIVRLGARKRDYRSPIVILAESTDKKYIDIAA